jgi:three-Cys-motif partner protein
MSTTDNFFATPSEKSKVKTLIVTEFLKAYFPIINRSVGKEKKEIIYIDLFCGPGKYKDGHPSTPLALLDLVNNFRDGNIRKKLRVVFNDENEKYIDQLRTIVNNHDVVSKLTYPVEITNLRASDVNIRVHTFKKCPIFSFIDPWGYKDVSVAQTWELVENIGSDCVLFFNSNRFIMDINKENQLCHFLPIFGGQLEEVGKTVNNNLLGQKEKAERIVELFSRNLIHEMSKSKYSGYTLYVLPFGFEADDKEKISHHIVFITKSHKAITEMKKVMIKHSNTNHYSLLFDSKDQLQIALFHRETFIKEGIMEAVRNSISVDANFFNKIWTIDNLLEALDRYNMKLNYQVTPYSREEVKNVVEQWDKDDFVEIIIPKGRLRKRITYERKFKLKKELLV